MQKEMKKTMVSKVFFIPDVLCSPFGTAIMDVKGGYRER